MRVLVVDNYDSFTYNLVQYIGELGAEVEVVRNDQTTVAELLDGRPDRVVVSPGPCTPDEAGISLEAMRRLPEAGIPTLGVCLGHQALAQAFGDGRGLYAGLPQGLTVGRYHSLVVLEAELPECLVATSHTTRPGARVLMGVRHRSLPVEGVQFHPESVLTDGGKAMLANFLDCP